MKNESARLELREVRGPLNDLMTKLESEKGQEWNEALRRFLRKEDSWVTPAVPAPKKSSIREIGTFTLKPYKGKSDLKALVKSGNYGWTNDEITSDRFTAKVIGSLDDEVECVLVQSDKFQTSEEMLAWAKANDCERPTAGDALRFGIDHPEEQRKHPLVFLHEPVQGSDGYRGVLVLSEDGVKRRLSFSWFGGSWHSSYVFVFVRKRKKA